MMLAGNGALAAAAGLAGMTLARLGTHALRRDVDWLRRHTVDAVTGLPIRALWEAEVAAWLQADADRMSLAVVDVDDFKGINDAHGHPAGDRVLQMTASRLRAAARSAPCLLTRLGGDELGLAVADSSVTGEDLCVDGPVSLAQESAPVPVTASVGLIHCRSLSCPVRLSDALEAADAALYRAKTRSHD